MRASKTRERRYERSDTDTAQPAYDPLTDSAALIDGVLDHAVDGISFDGKDELYVYFFDVILTLFHSPRI